MKKLGEIAHFRATGRDTRKGGGGRAQNVAFHKGLSAGRQKAGSRSKLIGCTWEEERITVEEAGAALNEGGDDGGNHSAKDLPKAGIAS